MIVGKGCWCWRVCGSVFGEEWEVCLAGGESVFWRDVFGRAFRGEGEMLCGLVYIYWGRGSVFGGMGKYVW